jgi:hypothetical protein
MQKTPMAFPEVLQKMAFSEARRGFVGPFGRKIGSMEAQGVRAKVLALGPVSIYY